MDRRSSRPSGMKEPSDCSTSSAAEHWLLTFVILCNGTGYTAGRIKHFLVNPPIVSFVLTNCDVMKLVGGVVVKLRVFLTDLGGGWCHFPGEMTLE